MKWHYEDEDVKVKIIPPKTKSKLLVNATLIIKTDLFGIITIKSFQIWPSPLMNGRLQEKINIEPPSIMIYGRPFKFVFFEDKKVWFEIEHKIYSAYCNYRSKKSHNEDIDPNELPI